MNAITLIFAFVSLHMPMYDYKVPMPYIVYDSDKIAEYHAYGAFDPKTDTIYLRTNWDEDSSFDRKILVHEMTHHFQKIMQLPSSEAQAYSLQDLYE